MSIMISSFDVIKAYDLGGPRIGEFKLIEMQFSCAANISHVYNICYLILFCIGAN